MTSPHDIAWLPESQVLKLCGLSRSTLQSWVRGGLDLAANAAYDLRALVALTLLAETRNFLMPKEMLEAWAGLVRRGQDESIVDAARSLEWGDRFDLVIDVTYTSLRVVQSEAELLNAVVHPRRPRPVVVLDMAEPVLLAVEYFQDHANRTPVPEKKGPGRPRSAARVHSISEAGDG
jgi:hypothetical protein